MGTLPIVLAVDDNKTNLLLTAAQLRHINCEVVTARSATEALDLIDGQVPALILLDIKMPGIDGIQFCRQLKRSPRTQLVPIVMVTALGATEDRVEAMDAGADDFLTKPVDKAELVSRVRSYLRSSALLASLEEAESVIFSLARAVAARDKHTEMHADRVSATATALARAAGLSAQEVDTVGRGALIHDIGKIGVPDAILLKPGPLTTEERDLMRRHPVIGERIVRPLRSAASLLPIIRHHHENVDGTGYPDRLAGAEIPLHARIVAISDAQDAMTSDRPYRPGMSWSQVLEIFRGGAGTMWDPELLALHIQLQERLRRAAA